MAVAFVSSMGWGASSHSSSPKLVTAPLRPRVALSRPAAVEASPAGIADSSGFVRSALQRLGAVALCLASAAAWRRATVRPGSGRVVVYGRNYEKNIKTKKGPREARDAKITKKHLSRIQICLQQSSGIVEGNAPLDRLIRAALKENVPRATIDNRIKKFKEEKVAIDEVMFGGYGTGGTAVLVQCTSDNKNRTRTLVATAFKDAGGQMGVPGCVDNIFQKRGVLRFEGVPEDKVLEAGLEAEVEDTIVGEDGEIQAITTPENLHSAAASFTDQGLEPKSYEHEYAVLEKRQLNEEKTYDLKYLIHLLEELDDVEDVYHNGEIVEDVELKFSPYGVPFEWKKVANMK